MARYLIGNVKGPKGDDGFSPVATVTQTANGATISITDSTGTTTANIANGESRSDYDLAVANGYTGTPAEWLESLKGISPVASVAQSGDNAVITVTDASGTTSATISAGGSYRAGEGIDITDGVISVTDAIDIDLSDYATIDYVVNLVGEVEQEMASPYTAGDGIEIDENNEISVDTTTIATKDDLDDKQDVLTAGVGISISNNEVAVDTSTIAVKSELFSGNYNDLSNKPDLADFADATEVTQALAGKQDVLTVGPNISLVNNVISATDTTYTAGTGISISNGVISATGGSGVSDPIEFTTDPDSSQNYVKADFGTFEIGLARYNSNDDFVNGVVMANDSVTVSSVYYPQGGGESVAEVQLAPGAINFRVDDVFMNNQLSWGSDSDHLAFGSSDLALASDLPQPDGTTITESNGVWSAVGGGDTTAIKPTVEITALTAAGLAPLAPYIEDAIDDQDEALFPKAIVHGKNIYWYGGFNNNWSTPGLWYTSDKSVIVDESGSVPENSYLYLGFTYNPSNETFSNINSKTTSGVVYALSSDIPNMPSFTTSDDGKMLTVVDNDGNAMMAWTTPSAGTVYTAGTGIDITNDEISVDSSTVAMQSDIPDVSGFVEASDLATVATTGSYNDLSNTPTIPVALTAGDNIDITSNVISLVDDVVLSMAAGMSDTVQTEITPGAVATILLDSNEDAIEYTTLNQAGVIFYNSTVDDEKTLEMDRSGNLLWDGDEIALAADIPAEELPEYTSSEIGKVLGVVAAGAKSPLPIPELSWVTPSGGSGITEDDIKNELIIESDHNSGDPYKELFISCDDIHITNYNEDDNEVGNVGMSYISETSYSEEDGDDIITQNNGELYPTTIAFTYTQTNETQDETVADTVARITPNFDDNVIEVEFEDNVAGTMETKTIAFVEDLPTNDLAPARYLYLTDANDIVYQIGVDTSGNLTVTPMNNN